jgi:6-phosphofructokinase 2
VVLDTTGPALVEALKVGVYLFKPSLRELRDLTGQDLLDEDSQMAAVRQIIASGQAEIVALSLGSEGALLVNTIQAWRAPGLSVNVKTTIGAGDSFLAALTYSLTQTTSLELAMKQGMAAGAAALLSPGTSLCQSNDLHQLLDGVSITLLKLNKTI